MAAPAATPVTTPVTGSIVATEGSLLLQLPPPFPVLVNGVVDSAHKVAAPLTIPELGSALIVMSFVAIAVPHVLVTI